MVNRKPIALCKKHHIELRRYIIGNRLVQNSGFQGSKFFGFRKKQAVSKRN
jgi:hypothetical protein